MFGVDDILKLGSDFGVSEEAITKAMINELCSGRRFTECMKNRQHIASTERARIAKQFQNKNSEIQLVASVPEDQYFKISNKYGNECWSDNSFIKDYTRFFPEHKASNI